MQPGNVIDLLRFQEACANFVPIEKFTQLNYQSDQKYHSSPFTVLPKKALKFAKLLLFEEILVTSPLYDEFKGENTPQEKPTISEHRSWE